MSATIPQPRQTAATLDRAVVSVDGHDHIRALDGLRGLCALYVALHHAYLTVWPGETGAALQGAAGYATRWMQYGHFAVSVFIVISGFCLGLPLARRAGRLSKGALGFWKARARRILPAYYASMALSLLLIATYIGRRTGTHWDVSLPVTPAGVAQSALLVQNVSGSTQINHVFWSIAVECQIYLLFPLLALLWSRAGASVTAFACVVIGSGAQTLLKDSPWDGAHAHYLGLFGMGMLGAQIASGGGPAWLRRPMALRAICLVAAMGFAAALARGWVTSNGRRVDLVVGVGAAAFLVLLSQRGGVARRALSWKPLTYVGAFSYSLYLIHAPLEQAVWQALPVSVGQPGSFALLLVVSMPIVLLAAYAFFRLFEHPFLSEHHKASLPWKRPAEMFSTPSPRH